MKEQKIDLERSAQEIAKKKSQRALMAGAATALLVIGALLFAGMKIEAARYSAPLPANEACFKAAHDQKLQLQANVNAQFGTPIPEGTPSAEQVAKLLKDCEVSRETYTVNVAIPSTTAGVSK